MATAVIWKYPLVLAMEQEITIPRDARVLTVQLQQFTPTLWALVDPSVPVEQRTIRIVGTGHPFDSQGQSYLGTWQADGFVWHVFDGT